MNTQSKVGKTARRTESKEVRRQQLIDAAIESIAKHGIAGTTMSTVTETAGLSLGIVNFHFKSKQNLFEETLVTLAREHHEQWKVAFEDETLSPSQQLLAVIEAHFHRNVCSRKKLAVWFAFFGEGGRRAVYRKLIDDIDDERLEKLTDLIEKISVEGGYKVPPAKHIACTLEGLFDGLWLNILMYPGFFSPTDGRKQIHAYLSALFPRHFDLPEF
jgi:TetR/AcrR family transcriptional repressor of bet genes